MKRTKVIMIFINTDFIVKALCFESKLMKNDKEPMFSLLLLKNVNTKQCTLIWTGIK